jgi:hypothetical protein
MARPCEMFYLKANLFKLIYLVFEKINEWNIFCHLASFKFNDRPARFFHITLYFPMEIYEEKKKEKYISEWKGDHAPC